MQSANFNMGNSGLDKFICRSGFEAAWINKGGQISLLFESKSLINLTILRRLRGSLEIKGESQILFNLNKLLLSKK